MARPFAAFGIAVCVLVVHTGAATAQQKPRTQSPRKPAAAKPAPAAPAPAPEPPKPAPPKGVKIVTALTQGAQVFQNTTYIQGARQRVEFPGVVSLDQCDLQRTVILNGSTKKYTVQPYGAATPTTPSPPVVAQLPQQAAQQGGVVVMTTTLTDTLERQTLFGLDARRIKTLVTKQTDATACDKTPFRVEIDAWYVDLPSRAACPRTAAPAPEPDPAGGCRDRVETRVAGNVTLGFPVKTTTTTTSGDAGKPDVTSTVSEVTVLEIASFDPALFDVPSDYTEAKSGAELLAQAGGGGSLEDLLLGSTADGTSQAAPKRPGVTRVGVLEPLNKSSRTLNTRLLRQDLTAKFTSPYEALPLSGSSAADIEADARRLECDYILLAEITEVKTTKPGKMGGFLKMASGSGPPKDVHEVKTRFTLFATGNTASARASGDVKASSGGGFGLGSALKMASFAGQMYMGMGMMRGIGGFGGLGMGMNPMNMMASMGGLGPMAQGYFDPRAAAMTSVNLGMGALAGSGAMGIPGAIDPADQEVLQTASDAFENIAKTATAKLAPAKSTERR